MMTHKITKTGWLGIVAATVLLSAGVRAQQMLPTDVEAAQLQDAIAQTTGEFDQMNLGYIHSLGMQQKAWNDPLSHMGEGQIKPGYSRYNWSPDVILPLRLREGMMTLVNLPSWELIEKVHIGSPESFGGEIAAPNSLLVYADPSYIGVDCNMIVFGRSGNRYVFYLRSETYNTDKITQSVVDVLVGPRYTPVDAGGTLGNFNGATATMSSTATSGYAAPGWSGRGGNSLVAGGAQNPQIGLNTASTGPKDWLKSIPTDPESFRFDIDMYLPNPEDVDIAPDNVWRDNIFTYIDLGPKALTMTQRPVVNLIVQDSEVPVGFRTRGPNSRLIVVEAIGDLVLRNGKKIICLKLRRDPASGLEWVDYSGSEATSDAWHAPAQPDTVVGGDEKSENVDALLTRKQEIKSMDGTVIQAGSETADVVDSCENDAYAVMMAGVEPVSSVSTEKVTVQVMPTKSAGVIEQLSGKTTVQKTEKINKVAAQEIISVELASNANIADLETEWERIYEKNQDVLKGYEPYYSVDATADGDVRELFRLRVGPVKDVKTGDAVCRKLGRRGFTCSVIRVQ